MAITYLKPIHGEYLWHDGGDNSQWYEDQPDAATPLAYEWSMKFQYPIANKTAAHFVLTPQTSFGSRYYSLYIGDYRGHQKYTDYQLISSASAYNQLELPLTTDMVNYLGVSSYYIGFILWGATTNDVAYNRYAALPYGIHLRVETPTAQNVIMGCKIRRSGLWRDYDIRVRQGSVWKNYMAMIRAGNKWTNGN